MENCAPQTTGRNQTNTDGTSVEELGRTQVTGAMHMIAAELIARVEQSPLMERSPARCTPEEQQHLVALLSALPKLRAGQVALHGVPDIELALIDELWPELGAALRTVTPVDNGRNGGISSIVESISAPRPEPSLPEHVPAQSILVSGTDTSLRVAAPTPIVATPVIPEAGRAPFRESSRLGPIVAWVLTVVGCAALVVSPRLPWAVSSSTGEFIMITGFNAVSVTLEPDTPWTQVRSLLGDPTDTSLEAAQSDGSSSDATIPSLSGVSPTAGGTDAGAKWGIFVLILGLAALFTWLSTLWAEDDRRGNLAGGVFVLGALALVPLLHDMLKTIFNPYTFTGQTVGIGFPIGLAGAVIIMIGSGRMFWKLRVAEA